MGQPARYLGHTLPDAIFDILQIGRLTGVGWCLVAVEIVSARDGSTSLEARQCRLVLELKTAPKPTLVTSTRFGSVILGLEEIFRHARLGEYLQQVKLVTTSFWSRSKKSVITK